MQTNHKTKYTFKKLAIQKIIKIQIKIILRNTVQQKTKQV